MANNVTKWPLNHHRKNQMAINARFTDGNPEGNLFCYWNGKEWVIEKQRRKTS